MRRRQKRLDSRQRWQQLQVRMRDWSHSIPTLPRLLKLAVWDCQHQ
jgi:hypothetical protein